MKKNILFFLLLINLNSFCADAGKDSDSETEREYEEILKGDRECYKDDVKFFEQARKEIDEEVAKIDSPSKSGIDIKQVFRNNLIKAFAKKLAKRFPRQKKPNPVYFSSYDSDEKESNESRCCCCDSLYQYLFFSKNKKS